MSKHIVRHLGSLSLQYEPTAHQPLEFRPTSRLVDEVLSPLLAAFQAAQNRLDAIDPSDPKVAMERLYARADVNHARNLACRAIYDLLFLCYGRSYSDFLRMQENWDQLDDDRAIVLALECAHAECVTRRLM